MQNHNEVAVHGALLVRLRHRTEDLNSLSRALGMPTTYAWLASDLLERGHDLPPRLRGESHWASRITLTQREFGETLSLAVDVLLSHKSELEAFRQRGGKIELYLQFNGELNTGDGLPPTLLRSIALLDAELQVEVFPKFSK